MKNYIKLIATLVLVLCITTIKAQDIDKQDISVLYVGYSSEKPMPENLESSRISGGMTPERFKEEYGKRMPAFEELLNKYFIKVTSVDARDYNEEMSKAHDVTIFDQAPDMIKDRVIHNDPETGKFISMEPAKFVSDDFDSPSVFIGHTSSVIGASLGSKLDWYCLCLDRHAHHIKTEHAIFKGPYKTDITLEKKATPKGVLKAFDGQDVPEEIPMWEVNSEGYKDGKGFRVGMVARGWGFEDSPHSEIISSGVCTKQKTAVALGRHGNFFLWGFAGSPDYMTEEAKRVFVNAIVYTHEHADDKMIVRKYNERIATKQYIDEMIFYTTEKSYLSYVEFLKDFNENSLKEKEKLKEKKASGKDLTQVEKMILNSRPQEILTREGYLKKNIGRNSWSSITGLDTLAIRKYLNENRDYFYSEPDAFYEIKVDEDVKSLGVANTNIAVLDKAITMLEDNADADKAYRILMRYTLEDFKTAKEWRTWFNTYRDKLFFTEVGGYVWMVNDKNANPRVRPRSESDIALKESKRQHNSKI